MTEMYTPDGSNPRYEINRDPFSHDYGKPLCADCKERIWSEQHACRVPCRVCGERTWGRDIHKRCCLHPDEMRASWDHLDIRRARNGQRNYFLPCRDCGGDAPVKHALVPDWAKTMTPGTDNADDSHPCARCDNTLTEYHHFAPAAIFVDSHLWPGAWLCKACHTLWHGAMREAAGYRLSVKRHCDWSDDDRRYATWLNPLREQA